MAVASNSLVVPERFSVERNLGRGGFGTVFAVRDKESQALLALKRLERIDPNSIYRFKQEFRGLTDIVHPNLVRLHELFAQDGVWCFTMEHIDGVRFDTFVRGLTEDSVAKDSTRSSDATPTSLARPRHSNPNLAASKEPEFAPLPSTMSFDEGRLREGLKQLVQGLLMLHAAGILHRDLKPANVLVERTGRVVILDFGMAVSGLLDSFHEGSASGTPAYMSPEQALGAPLTMASDWYAVGVILYEALTGHLPFGGTVQDMVTARTTREPRDPRVSSDALPDDLCELALALLRREPTQRPSGLEIAGRVGIDTSIRGGAQHVLGGAFVGRVEELQQLQAAFAKTKRGRTVVAHVHGASGFGKTTLIRRFLTQLALHDQVVTLEGRCYERESVPFKALDDLVDALCRYLARLRPMEAAGLVPRDARALVRLFPSLGRLEMMTTLPGRIPTTDPHELRRRAFAAIREVFSRITDTRPLVLFIDDVHWGDADSAALLRNLLAPPEVPPLLLVVGYRGDEPDNELLRTLTSPAKVDAAWDIVDIPLGPLRPAEAEELALSLLGNAPDAARQARLVAEESAQSPLFIAELVRTLRKSEGEPHVSIGRIVLRRIAALPEDSRRVVEVLACSERPLDVSELSGAARLGAERVAHAIDRLRDEHLAYVGVNKGRTVFEIFHDKIRRAVLDELDVTARRAHHLRLAESFEASRASDPETIARHYRAAGAHERALTWTERAGDNAVELVAFDLAVGLYEEALQLATGERQYQLMSKLAGALARAGRGAKAAEAYLWLREHGPEAESSNTLQLAAEQYLRAGHVDEALALFGSVLKDVGLALPKTPSGALVSLLWGRARLKWSGLGFRQRKPEEMARAELRKIDLCWVLANGLQGIDLVRSAHYYTTSLRLALKAGETARVSRALSVHAAHNALESTEGMRRGEKLHVRSEALAREIDDADALGWAKAAEAVFAWARTDLVQCPKLVGDAVKLMRERSESGYREIGSLQVWFALHALFLSGELSRVAQLGPEVAREAEARGDRYTLSTVRAYVLPLVWAVQDRPDEGRREAEAAISVWPSGTWYHQHWAHLRAQCFLDLYEGQGARVLERARAARKNMKQSMQFRIRTLRLEFNYLEGRGALETMTDPANVKLLTRLVREKIRRLDQEDNELAAVYARTLEAGLSARTELALHTAKSFARASQAFEHLGMPMHVAAAEWRRGECLAGEVGENLIALARRRIEALGVKSPSAFVDLLLPTVPKQ